MSRFAQPKLVVNSRMRSILSFVTTLGIIALALWVLSVQYPEEAKSTLAGVRNTFGNIVSSVDNNRSPQDIHASTNPDNTIDFDANYAT